MGEEKKKSSHLKWIASTIISVLGAGGGIVALLTYFNARNSSPPTQPTQTSQAFQRPLAQIQQRPPQPKKINLTGNWAGMGGLSYVIQQVGTQITFQETHPTMGVTAVGQGEITHRQLNVTYRTNMGTVGVGNLEISSDGRRLSGSVIDQVTGASTALVLSKIST